MKITYLPPPNLASFPKLAEQSAQQTMRSVSGAVQPVFDSGKSGIVTPPAVNFGKETFDAMEAGALTYKKPHPPG